MSNFLQDLTCTHCGAPIKTTEKPGVTITCNCCGSAFLIPDLTTNVQNVGIQVGGNTVIQGDVVLGDKIVASGDVIQIGKNGKIIIVEKRDQDKPEATQ